MVLFISLAILINSLTYITSRFITSKGIRIVPMTSTGLGSDGPICQFRAQERHAIYLIGGIQCRTQKPFNFILPYAKRMGPVYLVEYRNFGLDIELAAENLRKHICENNFEKATFIAVSLGWQVASRSARPQDVVIALNPCLGYESVQQQVQKAVKLLPLGYLVSIAIGWLSYAPVVKMKSGIKCFDASLL